MWHYLSSAFYAISFGAGLLVGVALTLRYVVVGIYHPIIREMEAIKHEDDEPV